MINYFNFKEIKNKYLITNDLGRYEFVNKNELTQMIRNNVDPKSVMYNELRDKYFIYDENPNSFIENAGMALRYYKQYLFQASALHIFVVTKRCNQKCIYCQASTDNILNSDMTKEVAKAAVEIAISSPIKNMTFEFQGGEPLLNFDTVKFIIEYAEEIKKDKIIEYVIVTNLTMISNELLSFLSKYKVKISTSVDGDGKLHTSNRPMINNFTTAFEKVMNAISTLMHNNIQVSAMQTTTRNSLDHFEEIVDQYINCGFKSIFLRPLTPLGFAKDNWDIIGYSPEEFISFYKAALVYIIKQNLSGIKISEGHARIFLSKILCQDSLDFMELRSPCGGGIGQIAYYYDGNIYTCDEARMLAEMGNDSFKMGDVFTSTYNDLMSSDACKVVCVASTLESHNQCSDCVYSPYCGTCPVISLALTGSPYSQMGSDYRCRIYKGILDTIFELLLTEDSSIIDVFKSWVE